MISDFTKAVRKLFSALRTHGNYEVLLRDATYADGTTGYLIKMKIAEFAAFVLASASSITSKSASVGVGYATGAGGAVTQLTSKSTGVTLNKPCGQITMHNATLNAGIEVAFTLTNSTIVATDVVVVSVKSGGTSASYLAAVTATGAGSCEITLSNLSAGNLGEAVVLNFAVIKGVGA